MVTLAVLSVGLVFIFKIFIFSVDHLSRLANRLTMTVLLDNRLIAIDRYLKAYNALPVDLPREETVDVGFTSLKYTQEVKLKEIAGFNDIFELEVALNWTDHGRTTELRRTKYLSDFKSPIPSP